MQRAGGLSIGGEPGRLWLSTASLLAWRLDSSGVLDDTPEELGRDAELRPFLPLGCEPGVGGRDFALVASPNELMRGLESVKPNRLNRLPLRDEFGEVCSRMTTSVRISTGPAVCAPDE